MDRRIFEYENDLGEPVKGDPTRIERVLIQRCEGRLSEVLKLSQSQDPEQADHYMKALLLAISFAFDVQVWDPREGSGFQEEELLDLLDKFFVWKQKKNPSIGNGPTSPESTDSRSSPQPSPPKDGNSISIANTGSG